MLEHKGIRWGYVFLRASSYLNAEETQELMIQAHITHKQKYIDKALTRPLLGPY